MPMDTSLFRSVEAGTYMGDCDIGEIFLNLKCWIQPSDLMQGLNSRIFSRRRLKRLVKQVKR